LHARNKVDLCDAQREVSTAEAAEWCRDAQPQSGGLPFFETSAMSRLNVEEAFFEVVRQWHRFQEPEMTTKEARRAEKAAKKAAAAERKAAAARAKEVRRESAIAEARPKPIPDTVLPALPAPAMPGELRRLHERVNTGADCAADVEFEFSADDKVLAHKVVLLAHAPGLLRGNVGAPVEESGLSRVAVSSSNMSPLAFRHLLSFLYSGSLDIVSSSASNDDDNDDDNGNGDSAPLWGPWPTHRDELAAAAKRYDLPQLALALEAGRANSQLQPGSYSLGVMLSAEFLADAEIVVRPDAHAEKDSDEGSISFPAHQAVLRARSPYLDSLFASDKFAEGAAAASSSGARAVIQMDGGDCCVGAVRRALAYLYEENDASLEHDLLSLASSSQNENGGKGDRREDASVVCMDLWRLARRWEVERLSLVVERVLVLSFTADTVCFFADEAFSLAPEDSRGLLLESCIDFASYRFETVSKTASFAALPPELQQRFRVAARGGVWEDPEAPGQVKLKKKWGVWKAALLT
jgi:Ras family/BTB/POZ domain